MRLRFEKSGFDFKRSSATECGHDKKKGNRHVRTLRRRMGRKNHHASPRQCRFEKAQCAEPSPHHKPPINITDLSCRESRSTDQRGIDQSQPGKFQRVNGS